MSDILSKNTVLKALLDQHLDALALREGLDKQVILEGIEKGTMVLLGNPAHKKVRPILVGQPSSIKVNANIGTSPLCSNDDMEIEKLHVAEAAGADTVMDLSIPCSSGMSDIPLVRVSFRPVWTTAHESRIGFAVLSRHPEVEAEAMIIVMMHVSAIAGTIRFFIRQTSFPALRANSMIYSDVFS